MILAALINHLPWMNRIKYVKNGSAAGVDDFCVEKIKNFGPEAKRLVSWAFTQLQYSKAMFVFVQVFTFRVILKGEFLNEDRYKGCFI